MELISIIVPIYNVDKYLTRCIDSIRAQTYSNIEIILVNDGSTDNSLALCESYVLEDNRVKLINKVNEGVAIARNTGLKVAKGKYIAFVDPDDWIEAEMYESLHHKIKETECLICLCDYYKDTKLRTSKKCFAFEEDVLDQNEIRSQIIPPMIGIEDIVPKYSYIMGCVWRGLFDRTFIETNKLCFEPGITIMEDLVFMVKALLKVPSAAFVHKPYYHYVQNPKSVLHSYNQKMWSDQMRVHDLLESSLSEAELEEVMRNRLDMRYIGMVFAALKNETFTKNNQDFKERMEHIKAIYTDEKLRMILERIKPIDQPSLREDLHAKEYLHDYYKNRLKKYEGSSHTISEVGKTKGRIRQVSRYSQKEKERESVVLFIKDFIKKVKDFR